MNACEFCHDFHPENYSCGEKRAAGYHHSSRHAPERIGSAMTADGRTMAVLSDGRAITEQEWRRLSGMDQPNRPEPSRVGGERRDERDATAARMVADVLDYLESKQIREESPEQALNRIQRSLVHVYEVVLDEGSRRIAQEKRELGLHQQIRRLQAKLDAATGEEREFQLVRERLQAQFAQDRPVAQAAASQGDDW